MDTPNHYVLVGVDFSPGAERALAQAAQLAERLGAELHVIHVFAPLSVASAHDASSDYRDVDVRIEEERQHRRERCAALCAKVVGSRVHMTISVVSGMPFDALMNAIAQLQPELVVVGSHGHGGLLQKLLGSVSASLCRHSPVPVLVVPSVE